MASSPDPHPTPRCSHPSATATREVPCRPGSPLPGPTPRGAGHQALKLLSNELTPCPVCSHALAEAPFLLKSVPTGPASTPRAGLSWVFPGRRAPTGQGWASTHGLCLHVFWMEAGTWAPGVCRSVWAQTHEDGPVREHLPDHPAAPTTQPSSCCSLGDPAPRGQGCSSPINSWELTATFILTTAVGPPTSRPPGQTKPKPLPVSSSISHATLTNKPLGTEQAFKGEL